MYVYRSGLIIGEFGGFRVSCFRNTGEVIFFVVLNSNLSANFMSVSKILEVVNQGPRMSFTKNPKV